MPALDHYATLAVDPSASESEVRRAYRRQAKKIHPDANASDEATLEFQRLQDAYRVLQNPHLRLAYDASRVASRQPRATFPEFGGRPNMRPFACRSCRQPTAQPRYAIYWSVVSNLIYAVRTADVGMFCADCARRSSLRASLVSALFGWWSLPGLVLTPASIFRNAMGGERPRGTDTWLLWNSALLFYAKGDAPVARGLAMQVAARGEAHSALARNMILSLQPRDSGSLGDAWRRQRSDRWKHLLLGLVVPAAVAALLALSDVDFGSIAISLDDANARLTAIMMNWLHGVPLD
jgi:curved DNA-binding protein CbpA